MAKTKTQRFVTISSNINITVTSPLVYQDLSNPDAHVPDRLRVTPLWPKLTVDIMVGVHQYPAMIAEWPTVKSLVKDKILTIAGFSDDCEDAKTVETAKKLENNIKDASKKMAKDQMVGSLEEIAGGDEE